MEQTTKWYKNWWIYLLSNDKYKKLNLPFKSSLFFFVYWIQEENKNKFLAYMIHEKLFKYLSTTVLNKL